LIIKGVKTSTTRLSDNGEYAETLILTDGSRKIEARLLKVENLKLAEAAKHYASEGFESEEKYLQHLRRIYPSLTWNDTVTVIFFTLKP
ncbi:MAG: ASCH domain-containing protein, partial [Nitrososphaerota archaeon]|nr:ASCH domain-containing protein [Nitrososphaerota archaeon]